MKFNPIGKSGLITSNLTLGTMLFGENSTRTTPEAEAIKITHHFIEAGGNHIDTADVYAGGRSEEILGKAIAGKRQELVISTKVRFPMGKNPNNVGLSRRHITEGVESSLRRMNTDYIDLLYVHCYDRVTPLEETIRALDDLVKNGKVRYLGISNFKAWQLMKAQALTEKLNTNRFIAAQYQYSLVKRDIENEFFDLMEDIGVGLLPWSPLGGGFLTGKYKKEEKPTSGRISDTGDDTEEAWSRRSTEQNWKAVDMVDKMAAKYNATHSQIALAWLLAKELVSSVIIGPRTMEQLKDNLGAKDIPLTVEDIALLNQASQPGELYPYGMIDRYSRSF